MGTPVLLNFGALSNFSKGSTYFSCQFGNQALDLGITSFKQAGEGENLAPENLDVPVMEEITYPLKSVS